MDFDVLAFILRGHPIHDGHKEVFDRALKKAKKVAAVIGGHNKPRTIRDPFTTAERVAMITAIFPQEVADRRIHFVPQEDHIYNEARWLLEVQKGVAQVANTPFTPDPVRIGLIGHNKDATSYYLNSFPNWGNVAVENVRGINATDIRKGFFDKTGLIRDLPVPVIDFLRDFQKTPTYSDLCAEAIFIEKYKSAWANSPYPPTFHTVDAVVLQAGHILLVERGARPGKGLWALPGGFVNQFEKLRAAVVRELVEETRIALSEKVLDQSIRSWQTFDDPYRSQRGRTITTAFRIELDKRMELPRVKGSDDAAKAKWVPLSQVSRSVMFEDHYDIIEVMAGI